MAIYKGQWEDNKTGNVLYPHTSTDVVFNSAGKNVDALLNEKSNSNHTHDDRYYTETEMNSKLNAKLDTTGNASNVTNTITQAATRTNLTTGEKLSISLGKIMKWFSDLKTVAFSGSYNDLTNKPTSLKNPTSMKVQLNGGTTEGTNQYTYDGSAAKNINITPSSIGASASNHNHDSVYSKLNHNHDNAYSKVVDGQGTLLKNVPMTPPQNKLRNGDFKINQRGQESYNFNTNGVYGLDCWQHRQGAYYQALIVTQLPQGGCHVKLATGSGAGLRQYVEASEFVEGQSYAIVISIDNKKYTVVTKLTAVEGTKVIQNEMFTLDFYLDKSNSLVVFSLWFIQGNQEHDINYCDVFDGTILYPHQKEDYATALMRCLPYCEYGEFAVQYNNTTYFISGFTYKFPKKDKPNIIFIKTVVDENGNISGTFEAVAQNACSCPFIKYNGKSAVGLGNKTLNVRVLITCEPLL